MPKAAFIKFYELWDNYLAINYLINKPIISKIANSQKKINAFLKCLMHFFFKDMTLRIYWRLSKILKTSNQSIWSNLFWYVKVCIFWKCIQYTVHSDKTQMLKTMPFGQNKQYQKCPPFSFVSFNSSQFYL